jgi:hypothetical protein
MKHEGFVKTLDKRFYETSLRVRHIEQKKEMPCDRQRSLYSDFWFPSHIENGLGDGRIGVRVPLGSRIATSPYLSGRPLGRLNLLSNVYRGLIPLHLVTRSSKRGYIPPLTHTLSWRNADLIKLRDNCIEFLKLKLEL